MYFLHIVIIKLGALLGFCDQFKLRITSNLVFLFFSTCSVMLFNVCLQLEFSYALIVTFKAE